MEIVVNTIVSGNVTLDPEDYYDYQDGAHTIQVQKVGYRLNQFGAGAGTITFTGGTGFRRLKSGELGSQKRHVYSGRGVPRRVHESVLTSVQAHIAEFAQNEIGLEPERLRVVR